MKKLLIPVLLVALVVPFLLGGCSNPSPTPAPTPTPSPNPAIPTEIYSASGTISVAVNEEFVIELDSNPSTGYSWQENHDQSYITLVDKTFEQDPGSKGMPGAGGTEHFRFKALKAGETKITMGYSRSWESKPPLEAREFTIKVK